MILSKFKLRCCRRNQVGTFQRHHSLILSSHLRVAPLMNLFRNRTVQRNEQRNGQQSPPRSLTPIIPPIPSPFATLPPDLLLLVLDYVPPFADPIDLSHVSHHWRDIVRTHVKYWQHLTLNCNPYIYGQMTTSNVAHQVRRFQGRLASSTKPGVDIEISYTRSDDMLQQLLVQRVLRSVSENLWRIRRMAWHERGSHHAHSLMPLLAAAISETDELPHLEQLELVDVDWTTLVVLPRTLFVRAQGLRHVILHGVVLEHGVWTDRASCITRLHYADVELMPAEIQVASGPTPAFLDIDGSHIFENLPNLRDFAYYTIPQTGSQIPPELRDHLLAHCSQLQNLGLHWGLLESILDEPAIRAVPVLTTYFPAGRKPALDARFFASWIVDADAELEFSYTGATIALLDPLSKRCRCAAIRGLLNQCVSRLAGHPIMQRVTVIRIAAVYGFSDFHWDSIFATAQRTHTLVFGLRQQWFLFDMHRKIVVPSLKAVRIEPDESGLWFQRVGVVQEIAVDRVRLMRWVDGLLGPDTQVAVEIDLRLQFTEEDVVDSRVVYIGPGRL